MSKSQSLIFQSSPTCPGEGAAVFPWWFWPFLAPPEHVGKSPHMSLCSHVNLRNPLESVSFQVF